MTDIHPNQRVAMLADAQNLYHSAQSLYSRNIDYSALLSKGVSDRELVRAIAYVIRADSPEEERFFEALQEIGKQMYQQQAQAGAGGAGAGAGAGPGGMGGMGGGAGPGAGAGAGGDAGGADDEYVDADFEDVDEDDEE